MVNKNNDSYKNITNEIDTAIEAAHKNSFDENGMYIKGDTLIMVSQKALESGTITIPNKVKSAVYNSIDRRNFSLKNIRPGEHFFIYTNQIIIEYTDFESLYNLLQSPGLEKVFTHSYEKQFIFKGPKLTKREEKIIGNIVLANEKKFITVPNEDLYSIMTNDYKIEDGILTRISSGLETINLPNGIKTIDLSNALFIRKITIPDSVKILEDNAFSKCYSLEEINLPDSIMKIGKNAFENCVKLKEISFNINTDKLGKGFLKGCKNLEKITLRYTTYEELKTFINKNLEVFYNIYFEHKNKEFTKVNIVLKGPKLSLVQSLSVVMLLDYDPRKISFDNQEISLTESEKINKKI